MYESSEDDDDFVVPAYEWSCSKVGASSKDTEKKKGRSPKTKPGVKNWVLLNDASSEKRNEKPQIWAHHICWAI